MEFWSKLTQIPDTNVTRELFCSTDSFKIKMRAQFNEATDSKAADLTARVNEAFNRSHSTFTFLPRSCLHSPKSVDITAVNVNRRFYLPALWIEISSLTPLFAGVWQNRVGQSRRRLDRPKQQLPNVSAGGSRAISIGHRWSMARHYARLLGPWSR